MVAYRIRQAAHLLGVSDDTVRRWIDSERIHATTDDSGRTVIEGAALADFARRIATEGVSVDDLPLGGVSARNRFTGLVTRVVKDAVMAQVDIQAGPHRVVSLMSREAADELGLEPGVLATASVKATNVVVGVPAE